MQSKPSIARLREIDAFKDVPEEQLEWLIDNTTLITYKDGEEIFSKGDPVDHMQIILEGGVKMFADLESGRKFINAFEKNYITGILPYSRMTHALGYGVAQGDTAILRLDRSCIDHMIRNYYDITASLVHTMTARVREFTQLQSQNEKLMALGKMSAGLAHELNNPASAMARSAIELRKHLKHVPDKFKAVIQIKVEESQVDEINQLISDRVAEGTPALTLMERTSREDDLLDLLEDHDVDDADELTSILVDYGFEDSHAEEILDITGEEHFEPVIRWVVSNLTTEKMVEDISEAAERISSLVHSVKSFSHMDQSQDFQTIDIHDGLISTFKLLEHKIQKRGHQLDLHFDTRIPKVEAMPGELNQVWMNILANSIDALDGTKGVITAKTVCREDVIQVRLSDNGPGIPPDVKSRIFEPFYTTKGVGKGTGLGLDIVKKIINRHQGDIHVESEPGNTAFTIFIPVKQEEA